MSRWTGSAGTALFRSRQAGPGPGPAARDGEAPDATTPTGTGGVMYLSNYDWLEIDGARVSGWSRSELMTRSDHACTVPETLYRKPN